MSLTVLAWLSAFLCLALRGFSRPVYACCAYVLTFYLPPPFWWWGKGILSTMSMRWNLIGVLIVIATMLAHWNNRPQLSKSDRWFLWLMGLYVANAFFVNAILADFPVESARQFDLVWKSVGLALVMRLCIWDSRDLHIMLLTIIVLSGYIGYEVVVNGAGATEQGRLEGLRFPGASGSNGVAAVLAMSLPFIGYFVICNPLPYSRIIAFCSTPLVLDTLLRCNSRGAYLGMAIGGICLLILARGRARKYAMLIVAGGVLAFCLQAQNGRIWERLFSVAASSEERDASAESRIHYWKAGLEMIADYPYGSGGRAAFVSPRGMAYISHIRVDEFRSVHNGYLNIAAGWGIQGLALLMLSFAIASWQLLRAIRRNMLAGNDAQTFLGAAILSALVGQAVTTVFGDYLDGEWFIWLAIFSLIYAGFDEEPLPADIQDDETEEDDEESDIDGDPQDDPEPNPRFR